MASFKKKATATLHTSMGDIVVELLHGKAPRTCENFARLARKGFYEGLTFHRILKGFMLQGGCPKGDGTGGPGYTIGPEFNDTPHVKGTLSMARSNDPHSAGSQFFVMHGDGRYLDSKYSAFATMTEGEEVIDKIAAVPVTENRWREKSQPLDPIYINRIELEGVDFDEDELAELLGKPQTSKQDADQGQSPGQSKGKGQGQGRDKGGDKRGGKSSDGDGQGDAEASNEADADADAKAEPKKSGSKKAASKMSAGKKDDGSKASGDKQDKAPKTSRKKSTAKRPRSKRTTTAKDGE